MYNTKYILGFTNDLNELYEIYFDFLDYVGIITQLTGTDDVLTIQCTGGDEDKMYPILGTEALINIFVDEQTPISIADLIATHDNDIRVTIYRDEDYTKAVFQGFIVVEDNSQPFMDPPFVLSLRATDGLGLLKGVDLVDTNDLLFVGSFSVVSWIAQILAKTDQTLNLRVYFNFLESTFANNINPLEQTFLDALTFSQGDGFNATPTDPTVDEAALSADDCYTALEKIVRCFRCRLFQEDGRWNLVSLYEYLNPAGFTYTEYAFGAPVNGIIPVTPVDTGLNQDYTVQVGKDQIVHPVTDDQVLYLKLATKWLKLTYNYDQSQNKICNQDLTDWSPETRLPEFDLTLNSDDVDITGAINNGVNIALISQAYQAYCFTLIAGTIATPITPDGFGFIRNILDQQGYTYLTLLVIRQTPGAGIYTVLQTSPLLVDIGDKFSATFSYRTLLAFPGRWEETNIGYIRFTGTDGSIWYLNNGFGGSSVVWTKSDTTTIYALTVPSTNLASSQNWSSFDMGTVIPTVPGSGTIAIYFGAFVEAAAVESWYKDISITIQPYLQGSYQQLKGDYNYSSSSSNIKQTEADDVEISDSPKRYFKGALLRPDGLSLTTPSWKRSGINESFRFTQLMERIMYNHLYRIVQKIEGTFRGLVYVPVDDPTVIIPNGFLNSYMFVDGDTPTKRFMLTSFGKDYGTGQSKNVYIETLADQNADGFQLPDAYQFSYIFQS